MFVEFCSQHMRLGGGVGPMLQSQEFLSSLMNKGGSQIRAHLAPGPSLCNLSSISVDLRSELQFGDFFRHGHRTYDCRECVNQFHECPGGLHILLHSKSESKSQLQLGEWISGTGMHALFSIKPRKCQISIFGRICQLGTQTMWRFWKIADGVAVCVGVAVGLQILSRIDTNLQGTGILSKN